MAVPVGLVGKVLSNAPLIAGDPTGKAALGGIQTLASGAKAIADIVQYRTGGQKDIDDRAREIAKDPSKAAVSIAEKRQMLGDAVREGSQLANIQDSAKYAARQAELRAKANKDVQAIAQRRMEQTYDDAKQTVKEADAAKEKRVSNLIGAGEQALAFEAARRRGFSDKAMDAIYGSDQELADRVKELEEKLETERKEAEEARTGEEIL